MSKLRDLLNKEITSLDFIAIILMSAFTTLFAIFGEIYFIAFLFMVVVCSIAFLIMERKK